MVSIIIGNICALLAAVSDSISGTRKNSKEVLGVQIISQFFYASCAIVLKGYSAVVQNVVAVFRNLLAMSGAKIKVLEWILTISGVVFGIYFNNRGFIGLLPVIANFEYTICVFEFKHDERKLKYAFLANLGLFIIFNVVILNFVGAATNLIVAVTTTAYLIKTGKKRAEGKKQNDGQE